MAAGSSRVQPCVHTAVTFIAKIGVTKLRYMTVSIKNHVADPNILINVKISLDIF